MSFSETRSSPLLTIDCVVQTPLGKIILIERRNEPFKNCLCLPGGFVEIGETVYEACVREMKEEINIVLNIEDIRLVGVYSDPHRDPRAHCISIAFVTIFPDERLNELKAGSDAKKIYAVSNWQEMELGFDHKRIITDTLNLN